MDNFSFLSVWWRDYIEGGMEAGQRGWYGGWYEGEAGFAVKIKRLICRLDGISVLVTVLVHFVSS